MPDFGAPVAAGVNVGPNQGLQTLSDLMGLKQQQQGLQLQGQALQIGAANVNAAQRQQQARGFLTNLMQSKKDEQGNSILGPDGQPDPGKTIAAVARNVPSDLAQPIIQDIIKTQTDRVGLESASANLDANERRMLMGPVEAAGLNPDVKAADINDDIDNLVAAHPEMGNAATRLKSLVSRLDSVPPEGRANAVNAIAAHMQVGQGVETQPTNVEYPTTAGTVTGTKAPPAAGGTVKPSGQIIAGTAGSTSAAGAIAGASARGAGTANIDVQRADLVSSLVQPSEAAIGLTQQIDSLADQIHSGKFADAISRAAADLGEQTDTYARQLLKKDMGQLSARATQNAPTDKRMETILSGHPEASSDPQTIHTAMDYIRGSFRQSLERGQLLQSYRQKHPDLTGFQNADDALTGMKDPLMTEFQSLQTPQERIGFYRRNFRTKQEAAAFQSKVQGVSHVTGQLSVNASQ